MEYRVRAWPPCGALHSEMARGPACARRTPHSRSALSRRKYQPACKPGFVGHRAVACTIRDGHSSGTTFARCLEQPTRTVEPDMALRCSRVKRTAATPSLFGFAPGVVCHAVPVAGDAVRSYRTFSPLPSPKRGRFVLCGTVPGVAPAGCYPAPYVDGARTFLPRSLSALAGAAVRPTDATGMGAQVRHVKPIRSPEPVKIIYPEDVVLRLVRSTDGMIPKTGDHSASRRAAPVKRS
jgi:hypothetical protein